VGHRRPLGGPAPLTVGDESYDQVRVEEPGGVSLDVLEGEAAGGVGAQVLGHVGLGEPGRPGAQPLVPVDQQAGQVLERRCRQLG
jgi:hypothetical protein